MRKDLDYATLSASPARPATGGGILGRPIDGGNASSSGSSAAFGSCRLSMCLHSQQGILIHNKVL